MHCSFWQCFDNQILILKFSTAKSDNKICQFSAVQMKYAVWAECRRCSSVLAIWFFLLFFFQLLSFRLVMSCFLSASIAFPPRHEVIGDLIQQPRRAWLSFVIWLWIFWSNCTVYPLRCYVSFTAHGRRRQESLETCVICLLLFGFSFPCIRLFLRIFEECGIYYTASIIDIPFTVVHDRIPDTYTSVIQILQHTSALVEYTILQCQILISVCYLYAYEYNLMNCQLSLSNCV